MSEFLSPESYKQNPTKEKIEKYFDSIVRVLASETKSQLISANTIAHDNNREFYYNGMDLPTLLESIDAAKHNIIRPSKVKENQQQIYPKEFALNFGLSDSQFEEIISRYL